MHDPLTVAFEIKYPWRGEPSKWFPKGYRSSFITIWHNDPERGGSDDSCGWSYPRVPSESQWFKELRGDVESAKDDLTRQKFSEGWPMWMLLWLNRASFRHRERPLSLKQQCEFFYSQSYPGNRSDTLEDIEAERFTYIIARIYLKLIRPWYRHPKWHVWHWQFQVHPAQQFKRWAFSRCAGCGRRFTYGYSPTSGSWYGDKPRWFRGERNVFHSECFPNAVPVAREPE